MPATERQDRWFATVTSAPVVITIGALFVYPMLYVVVSSFYRADDKTPAFNGTVGVENYLFLLPDLGFQSLLFRTSILCMFTIFGGVGLVIGIVSLLNRRFRG